MIEFCRRCRDEDDKLMPAQFVVWGKLFSPEDLGPRCLNHLPLRCSCERCIEQHAVLDLRPLVRAENLATVVERLEGVQRRSGFAEITKAIEELRA